VSLTDVCAIWHERDGGVVVAQCPLYRFIRYRIVRSLHDIQYADVVELSVLRRDYSVKHIAVEAEQPFPFGNVRDSICSR